MIKLLLCEYFHAPGKGIAAPGAESSSPALIKNEKEAVREKLLQTGLRIMGAHDYALSFTDEMLAKAPDGKPCFRDLPEIRFSLSHAGDYIACAFSNEEVGLDLQDFRPFSDKTLRIARRWFTPVEYEALLSLHEDDPARLQLFYRLWTVKEAYLKYLGCGLLGRMDSFLPDPIPFPRSALSSQETAPEHNITKGAHDTTERLMQGHIVPQGNPEQIAENHEQAAKSPAQVTKDHARITGSCAQITKSYTRITKNPARITEYPLSPADYILLPVPDGYAMTLCAAPSSFDSPANLTVQEKNCPLFENSLTVYTVR